MDTSKCSIPWTDAGVGQDLIFGHLVERWLVILEILTNIKRHCSKILPRAYLRLSGWAVGGGTGPALVIRHGGLNLLGLVLDCVEELLINQAWV